MGVEGAVCCVGEGGDKDAVEVCDQQPRKTEKK